MRSLRRQRGFSLLDSILWSAAVVGVIAATFSALSPVMREATLREALTNAKTIADAADEEAGRATATTDDPITHARQYTFGKQVATWTAASTIDNAAGRGLRTTSPYGTAYEYMNSGGQTRVRFVIPSPEDDIVTIPSDLIRENIGANTRVTYTLVKSPNDRRDNRRLRVFKTRLYLENTR